MTEQDRLAAAREIRGALAAARILEDDDLPVLDWLIARVEELEREQLLHVTAEVWPVAADETGLWLLSPDGPWPTEPIQVGSDPHDAATYELQQHGAWADTVWLHQTSDRTDGPALVTTLLAVIRCDSLALDSWPAAIPITTAAADQAGRPDPHSPVEPPEKVRYWDVLLHALRHLRFLADPALGNDADTIAVLDEHWRRELEPFAPAMAMMYDQRHRVAS